MSSRTEWTTAKDAIVAYGQHEDSYGNVGEGLIVTSLAGDAFVIEGTPDELHALLDQARNSIR